MKDETQDKETQGGKRWRRRRKSGIPIPYKIPKAKVKKNEIITYIIY